MIHAGAGGVGTYAIQLAKAAGAYVITTASPRNHELLQKLGADEIIDYHTTDFEEVLQDIDLVFDTMGATPKKSFTVLKPKGRLISILVLKTKTWQKKRHLRQSNLVTNQRQTIGRIDRADRSRKSQQCHRCNLPIDGTRNLRCPRIE